MKKGVLLRWRSVCLGVFHRSVDWIGVRYIVLPLIYRADLILITPLLLEIMWPDLFEAQSNPKKGFIAEFFHAPAVDATDP